MDTTWLAAEAGLHWSQAQQPDSPFFTLQGLADPKMDNGHTAARCRQLAEDIRRLFTWEHMVTLLPISLVVADGPPAWPGRHCRSHYQWLPTHDLQNQMDFQHLDPFELILRLFDFSAWRPLLGQRFRGAKGPPAFDPVSLGLGILLARYQQWSWSQLTGTLCSQRGADYRRFLGFDAHDLPCASTWRMALVNTPLEVWTQCADSLVLGLMAVGIIPQHSTYPADSPERGVSIALDSQLVQARSRQRCRYQRAPCWLPPEQRSCAAQAKGKQGCDCEDEACAEYCRYVTAKDPEARYVYYSGSNQPGPHTSQDKDNKHKPGGKHHFGYKAKGFQVIDDRLRSYWVLSGPYVPANRNDHLQTLPGFEDLRRRFPFLRIGEVLGDAGEGMSEILSYVYEELQALRLIDLRHHEQDQDPLACLRRGYDDKGVPLCASGYRLSHNGHDYQRRASKWVCRQRCRRQDQPDVAVDDWPQQSQSCPYRNEDKPLGFNLWVGAALPGGSGRLAREFRFASKTWKARMGRRNYAESRNACQTRRGLHRSPWCGLASSAKADLLGDILTNALTLARFVTEATLAPT